MPVSSADPFRFDFLVLGSGIAGLFYALQVAEHGRVAIVTKKRAAESAGARGDRTVLHGVNPIIDPEGRMKPDRMIDAG